MTKLLNGLNAEQIQAVTSDSKIILCIAGAGSGKTRVLTHRIAYLNQEKRVGTSNILALTFTRLAAKEMKERLIKLTGEQEGKKLHCSTFHAFCVKVLKEYGHLVGIGKNFTIYDQEDIEAIISSIIDEFGYKTLKISQLVQQVIQDAVRLTEGFNDEICSPETEKIAKEYLYRLKQNNAVTLDGLLRKTRQILRNQSVAEDYRKQYKHVFIDEFQDTDGIQFEIIRLINPENLFVVGDPDQNIYQWRGTRVENILEFPELYPCKIIKLERNYRSTLPIVSAANKLIKHNIKRMNKNLITEKHGLEIVYNCFPDEAAEAREVAKKALKLKEEKELNWSDIAILSRTNKQFELIEKHFKEANISYQLVGSINDPYKRHDIKSIFAYMEAVHNQRDSINLKKALSFPKPFISQLTLEEFELQAMMQSKDMINILQDNQHMAGVNEFLDNLNKIGSKLSEEPDALKAFAEIVFTLQLKEFYGKRVNKIDEINAAYRQINKWHCRQEVTNEPTDYITFLRWLRTKDMQDKLLDQADAVKLMTVHAAKGLEFPTVFVIGMNQNTFPSHRTADIEEERRLFYVAITRAKDYLNITRPEEKVIWGNQKSLQVESQFITEMGVVF